MISVMKVRTKITEDELGHTLDASDRSERDLRRLAGTRDRVALSGVSVLEGKKKEEEREFGLVFLWLMVGVVSS
jgi:hypothetical protein